jgi:predicted transcriptional regulator
MTLIARDLIRSDAKASAQSLARYAMSISPSVRIRKAKTHIERLLACKAITEADIVRKKPPGQSVCVQNSKNDTVSPLEPERYAPNPQTGYNVVPGEVAAWLKANGAQICRKIAKGIHRDESTVRNALKRMLERGEVIARPEKNKILYSLVEGVQVETPSTSVNRRRNARGEVLDLIAEHGPLTAGEVAEKLGLALAWATTLLFRMRDDHLIFTVGSKRNEKHYVVQVYHTDPAYVYIAPEPPKPADPIVEEKRPARLLSLAAVDRGLALIEKHFHCDSGGKAVFEQLCRRPQSVPELMATVRINDATVRFALRRLIQIGVVEEDGKEATFDRTNRKHVRQVYAVAEVNE